jgi:hypothetical protein
LNASIVVVVGIQMGRATDLGYNKKEINEKSYKSNSCQKEIAQYRRQNKELLVQASRPRLNADRHDGFESNDC